MDKINIVSEENGTRIDKYINLDGISRAMIQALIDDGKVTVNGKNIKNNYKVKYGDNIEIMLDDPKEANIEAEDIPLDIVYEDKHLLVVNKPQGMVVHPAPGNYTGTLVNALMYHCKDNLSGINGVLRPGIVHRIDKNTSGLLVVAKNDKAHISLAKQLEDKTCHRTYIALLEGVLKEDSGTITTYITRSEKDRTKMAVSNSGRLAITDFKVIKRYSQHTLCEFNLKTGRTHQIRVHAKHIGHPIVGDDKYGYKNQKFKLDGQLLHAYKLEFVHPTTNKKVSFVSEIPSYFEKILKGLR